MPPRKNTGRGRPPASVLPISAVYPPKKDGTGMDDPQWTACHDMLDAVYRTKEGR
jgi:hypothetical protein